MSEHKKQIKISIRNLVEFILRSGDIDNSFTGNGRVVERVLEGARIHKKIQKAQNKGYSAEVTLKHSVEFDDFVLVLEGRADGIINDNGSFTIDEIKTTTVPLDAIDENFNPVHWAQAKCYAFIYASQQNLDYITVRLTYCELETEELKYISRCFGLDELTRFFSNLINEYYIWAKLTYDWKTIRDASIKNLKFPFKEYRKGQRELAVAVYKTIIREKNLFVKAPTGIGKTISTLFPSVKALGEGYTSKLFYLTAKTITRGVAQEAFSIMREHSLRIKTVTLTAKEKICFMDKTSCNPKNCQYARGHFDRINEAVMDILSGEDELKRETIEEYARKHKVCPFEFSLDLTIWADAVICDYNYVFDPRVYLKRFFMDSGSDYTFLIDEAHNLVDRSREMFSAELSKKTFLKLKKDIKFVNPKLSKILGKLNSFMLRMRKLCSEKNYYASRIEQKDIYNILRRFVGECEEYLAGMDNKDESEELLQLYFDVLIYLKISEFYDERYTTYVEKCADDVRIKLFCLDPSYLLGEALKRSKAAVFFSATLLPMDYFREILGGKSDDYIMNLDSPFDTNNRCLMIADKISTRYQDREKSCHEVIECIRTVVNGRKGNYLVFFPSYQYMNSVYEVFKNQAENIRIYIQSGSMSEKEREEFLQLFIPDPGETVLGFCVMGGIFSEGIDLKDDRLIGAIIVGVGLPQICSERDIIREYFQERKALGFEYSYMYPGMNKVMQAAGRVIRSEDDKGVILLIDDRFTAQNYQSLFPKEWFPYIRVTGENIESHIKRFWNHRECI
ncbi:MAG: ATP-dependent DNA helicase [Bacillota bacterium]